MAKPAKNGAPGEISNQGAKFSALHNLLSPQDSDIAQHRRRIIVTFASAPCLTHEAIPPMPAIDNVIWEALTTRQISFAEGLRIGAQVRA